MRLLVKTILLFLAAVQFVLAQGGNLYVKVPVEKLRLSPNGDEIGALQSGVKVEVLERKPNWVRVQMTGWMALDSLTADSTLTNGFTMRASHILTKTEAEANTVLQELRAGIKFEDLAKKYSADTFSAASGGDLGEFKRGDLMPEFENAVLKLKPGETSGVVRIANRFHIIRRTR